MVPTWLEKVENLIINTGNILSLNDITKKPGQNPTEELAEAVSITIKDFQNNGHTSQEDQFVHISRSNDDLSVKIQEHDASELKIGLKIFLTSDKQEFLNEAIQKAFITLGVSHVSNIVIAFNQKQQDTAQIKTIWLALEEYVNEHKVGQIGIADVEEGIFKELFDWATVKPSIIQINLATCCVVSPSLQAFCKENDVQLLTHSDPNDILPEPSIELLLGQELPLRWVVRFLVHIKCRGVLTTKGYLLCFGSK